ncbi:MAG: EAL domain-containing protein, partial [Aeromicrobium sp.]
HGVRQDDLAARIVIAEGLGDVLTLQGVYGEAEAQLAVAHELVSERVHAAALDGKRGDLAFKQGDVPRARYHLEGAMARLGRPVPNNTAWLLIRLLWELVVQASHSLLPRLTTGRRSPDDRAEDFLAMRLHSRLAYLYWFYSGKVPCAWSHLRGLNLAERYPASAELGQAYSEHAPVMTMIPWFSRGLAYAERSLEIRRGLGDVWGQGQSLNFAGVTLYAASRFHEAEEACREAIRLLESTGDQWEVNTAGWTLAMSLYRQGELTQASTCARQVYATASTIGDQTAAGVGLSVWARASGGQIDVQLVDDELARGSEDASTTTELYLGAGLCALRAGDLQLARTKLEAASATIRKAGLRQEFVAPVASWNATVARLMAEQSDRYDPATRRRLMRRTAKAVRRARFWSWTYRNNLPHTLREAGLLAALTGRPRKSARLLARSLSVAAGQGARYEEALTRLALVQVGLSGENTPASHAQALVAVRNMEVIDESAASADHRIASVSLFDRFTTLLTVGRTIAAADTANAVEVAVREAALTLLRGERCHIVSLLKPLDEILTSESGESVDEVSKTLIGRAIEAGMPVVASDPTSDGSESLILSGIRSVLAAPIVAHGETVSCFYVTHRHIGQLFGDQEIQLAAFVANMAGAAFEHLAGTETRFRSLAQNSSDVLTLVGRDGVVTYQSSAVSRVFALPTPGLVGLPIVGWVHPDDLSRFSDSMARVERGTDLRIECRFQHADGSFRFTDTAVTNLLADPTVAALVLNTRDVTDRRHLEDELRNRALHDTLTGLPNRALFLERVEHALSSRNPRPMVVCFLDLDDFKAVNDTHGHGGGDELLCTVAGRLSSCLRPSDTVARFGGDEFAILLEDTDLATALTLVERLITTTADPLQLDSTDVVVHASVGVTPSAGRNSTPDGLLAEADAAMYAAKARGGHCFEIFRPDLREAIELRSRTRTELHHALAHQEFRLHYQPIVELTTGRLLGVEALVRWQHPELGLLAPAAFIDHAEESGQITAIDDWVLATACQAATLFPEHARISVNMSARQLQQPTLINLVATALERSGLAPHRLVLEITETATVSDVDSVSSRLTELKALGLTLALDDFGTGYSPLSYLRRFPVDYLKVDRSFVKGLTHSEEDRVIVRGVIDMAHSLGLSVIAEGVESQAQHDMLIGWGCDLGQGFLWHRPVPLEELPAWA